MSVTPYLRHSSRIHVTRSTNFASAAGSLSSRKPACVDMYLQPSSRVSFAPAVTIFLLASQFLSGTMPPVLRIVSSVE